MFSTLARLAFLLLFAWLGKHCNQKPRSSSNRNQPQDRRKNLGAALQAQIKQWEPDEKKHRRKERQYWRWSIVLSAVITAGAVASAFYASGAYLQVKRQADIAQASYLASTRAWVDVVANASDISITWKTGVGATLHAGLRAINNGSSPALDVALSGSLIVNRGLDGEWPNQLIKDQCTERIPVNGGDILFMKDFLTDDAPHFMAWYEVNRYKTSPPNYPDVPVESGFVPLYFIACVAYKIIGDGDWHHTGRIFYVGRLTGDEHSPITINLRINDDVSNGALVLVRPGIGEYAD